MVYFKDGLVIGCLHSGSVIDLHSGWVSDIGDFTLSVLTQPMALKTIFDKQVK